MLFKVLALLKLMFSDGIGGRLKVLASTKLKVETANGQSINRVCVPHIPYMLGFKFRVIHR